ncbi:MAG: zinc ribbon domain-containing protein [Clostridia bacterium]|nr:zinc ribbon domain-containing protein [Clostridia bacterium]
MKNCPHCNAVIQDDARFCLYCMKPLEKKAFISFKRFFANKITVIIAFIGILLGALVAVLLIILLQNGNIGTSHYTSSGDKTIFEYIYADGNKKNQ